MRKLFGGAYRNRRVLVTGHTGFKGSWLTLWLLRLDAEVAGYSKDVPTRPSNFEVLGLRNKIRHIKGDVTDIKRLDKAFRDFSPDIVFHLAAQALARRSYDIPRETFYTNLGGTVNILECLRRSDSVKAAVVVTSDKCYQNIEQEAGYREGDRLGGGDPYSASKACAEIAAAAYMHSFFKENGRLNIATARAGNVIGGGDWAEDRIIPDCVRAISRGKDMMMRNPDATRPWQHVLEPLSGYLFLGQRLLQRAEGVNGEAFNFGPDEKVIKSVREVIELFLSYWGEGAWEYRPLKDGKKESKLLRLCCEKAHSRLGWAAALDFEECVRMTAEWYKNYYARNKDMAGVANSEIDQYVERAAGKGLPWIAKGRV